MHPWYLIHLINFKCDNSGTTTDSCSVTTATGYVGTTPICSTTDGSCAACVGDDGMAGTGTGATDGTRGTCPVTTDFCCTDGSCAASGACP